MGIGTVKAVRCPLLQGFFKIQRNLQNISKTRHFFFFLQKIVVLFARRVKIIINRMFACRLWRFFFVALHGYVEHFFTIC